MTRREQIEDLLVREIDLLRQQLALVQSQLDLAVEALNCMGHDRNNKYEEPKIAQ